MLLKSPKIGFAEQPSFSASERAVSAENPPSLTISKAEATISSFVNINFLGIFASVF